jgi:hypothetical protein
VESAGRLREPLPTEVRSSVLADADPRVSELVESAGRLREPLPTEVRSSVLADADPRESE